MRRSPATTAGLLIRRTHAVEGSEMKAHPPCLAPAAVPAAPWLDLVRFHKEVVKRAEEGTFSFEIAKAPQKSWTFLDGVELDDLAGPWKFHSKSIRSPDFLAELLSPGPRTRFLGGPGYLVFKVGGDGPGAGATAHWEPLLYREVEVHDDGVAWWALLPEQGAWHLSPLVLKLLGVKGLALPKDPDEVVANVLDKAAKKANEGVEAFSSATMAAFLGAVPGLAPNLGKKPAGGLKPTPWTLFSAPATFGPLIFNLMRDYERLEEALSEAPDDVGGLRILEGGPHTLPKGAAADARPFVPLDPRQKPAVAEMLGDDPLTVVSGPPGCGKSQVVVSALLNAWARGQTVLFASNNNKAVDVVLERLRRFEREIPVGVRAGAKDHAHIVENLKVMLGAAATIDVSKDPDDTVFQEESARLATDRQRLQKAIDSGTPQVVTESWHAALAEHSEARERERELDDLVGNLKRRVDQAGFQEVPLPELPAAAIAVREWLEDAERLSAQADRNDRQREELARRRHEARIRRDAAAEVVGLDASSVSSWGFASKGKGPDLFSDWALRLRRYLAEEVGSTSRLAPVPWTTPFDEWASAPEAEGWISESRDFRSVLEETLEESGPAVSRVQAADERSSQATRTMTDLTGASTVASGPDAASILDGWTALFSEDVTAPRRWWDVLPWSERTRRRREIRAFERRLRPLFPGAFWIRVGDLEGGGRERLEPAVRAAREWLAALKAREDLAPERDTLGRRLSQLRKRARALRCGEPPASWGAEKWAEMVDALARKDAIAHRAAAAHRARENRDRLIADLRNLAMEGRDLTAANPLVEAWRGGSGRDLASAWDVLATEATPAAVATLRQELPGGVHEALLEAWRTVREAELETERVGREVERIPTREALLADWWGQRPVAAISASLRPLTFPGLEGPLRDVLLRLDECVADWNLFSAEEATHREAIHAADERAWKNLARAVTEASTAAPDSSLDRLVRLVNARRTDAWDNAEIEQVFDGFSVEMLRAKRDGLDQKLEDLAFRHARRAWKDRIDGDSGVTAKAIQALITHFSLSLTIPPDLYGAFRKALRAAPIWIVTAQSTQSIPLEPGLFDLVIVDEASQCTLTNILPLAYRGRRLAIIGDPNQLPAIPTILTAEEDHLATKMGLRQWFPQLGHAKTNVFDSASCALPKGPTDVLWLREHFRSHPLVIGFSNQRIYQKGLVLRRPPNTMKVVPAGAGVHVRQVAGLAEQGTGKKSWFNAKEADEVVAVAAQIRQEAPALSVGVVTPFTSQEKVISAKLVAKGVGDVSVGTAHKFQGDERDVILFSPVAANGITPGAVKFIQEPPNLLNVAVTRAREAVFLVGDVDYLRQTGGLLAEFAKYALTVETLRRTSAAELELFGWMTMRGWTPEVHVWVDDIEVDFVMRHAGTSLVVEVDGTPQPAKDAARDAKLKSRGYKVVHFRSKDVWDKPETCLRDIATHLGLPTGVDAD